MERYGHNYNKQVVRSLFPIIVLYIPGLTINLLFISQIAKQNLHVDVLFRVGMVKEKRRGKLQLFQAQPKLHGIEDFRGN